MNKLGRLWIVAMSIAAIGAAGCTAQRNTPHIQTQGLGIQAQLQRDDLVILDTVEASSTTNTILFGLVQVIDGDKLRFLGIPFYREKYVYIAQVPFRPFGPTTAERAYHKALAKTPQADLILPKSIESERTGVPLIFSTKTVTWRGKAAKIRPDSMPRISMYGDREHLARNAPPSSPPYARTDTSWSDPDDTAATASPVAFQSRSEPLVRRKVVDIRVARHDRFTRVVFQLDGPASYSVRRARDSNGQSEVLLDVAAQLGGQGYRMGTGDVKSVAIEKHSDSALVRIGVTSPAVKVREQTLSDPPRIVLDVYPPAV